MGKAAKAEVDDLCIANECPMERHVKGIYCQHHWIVLPAPYKRRLADLYNPAVGWGQQVDQFYKEIEAANRQLDGIEGHYEPDELPDDRPDAPPSPPQRRNSSRFKGKRKPPKDDRRDDTLADDDWV